MPNTVDCDANHERFITRVIESETVWALENQEGFAYADSNDEEVEDGVVLMFWSDRAEAELTKNAACQDYEPVEISLFDFLFRFLPGMAEDSVGVGTNWTDELIGLEVDPEELLDEILARMSPDMLMRYEAQLNTMLAEQEDDAPEEN